MNKFAATIAAAVCLLGLTAGPAAATTMTSSSQSGWLCTILRIKC